MLIPIFRLRSMPWNLIEPHGVTFELQMPEGMDTSEVSEVLELLEVLHNDIPEFDEMLIEAVNSINQESECPEVSVEGNQCFSAF